MTFTNINCFCIAVMLYSKEDKCLNVAGYISGCVTFILFLIILGYHIITEITFVKVFIQKIRQKFKIFNNSEDSEEVCQSPQISDSDVRAPPTFSEVPPPMGDHKSEHREGKEKVPHTKRRDTYELKLRSSLSDSVPYHLMQ